MVTPELETEVIELRGSRDALKKEIALWNKDLRLDVKRTELLDERDSLKEEVAALEKERDIAVAMGAERKANPIT